MRMCKYVFSVLLLIGSIGTANAQTNEGDYSITYGVNYSTADRKATAFPGFVGPASLAYRPKCFLMLGADDDTFVSNKTATGRATGIGDLAFEAHLRFWNFHGDSQGNCEAGTKISWNLDYVVTVPVGATLESKELVHQTKLTFNRPLDGKRGNFFANAGLNSSGLALGGTTQNALASANYLRYFHAGGAWGGEGELDLQSKSKIAPSSAVVLLAIDGALDKAQKWSIRFGSSFGVTPYAAKVSPFIQISFNGNLKGSNNTPSSVFTK